MYVVDISYGCLMNERSSVVASNLIIFCDLFILYFLTSRKNQIINVKCLIEYTSSICICKFQLAYSILNEFSSPLQWYLHYI